jgi:hypothetical protein
MIPAATEKACSIHSVGPWSLSDNASFNMVLDAAMQVRRVNENAEFENESPMNFRCI